MAEPVILVVDDEPGIILLCQRLLQRAGFCVFQTTNPVEGLAILERELVDLLLVDIRMPGMDGFQLLERARKRHPDLAVVIMTGFGTVETAIEALRRGADGLILKPFSGGELVQSVKHAMQESQQKKDVLRLQTLRPLFTITASLFSETNPERLQELILDAVCGHLRCTNAGLYQYKEDEASFHLIAGKGDVQPEECADEGGIVGRAAAWNALVSVNSEGPGDEQLSAILSERSIATAVAAPMNSGTRLDHTASILYAARGKGEALFRESDLETFAILAQQAAVALENARLHAELRAYIRQVEESQLALVRAEKMAIAGRLTASIAHEINNPLQSVQNCLHLAGRKELSPADRQNYLDMAQAELERLMHTVHRMLDYYRPGALDRKPMDMNQLVKRILSLVEQQLSDHKITLQARYASTLPPVFVVGDQIQQVLLNLCLNAIEAMPNGGKLVVETRSRKNTVDVLIEDTGPGVPAGEREHIFEPFVSTKEGGTGLGLAVSYGIMAAHGGSLDLITGRSRGACFRITLPVGAQA